MIASVLQLSIAFIKNDFLKLPTGALESIDNLRQEALNPSLPHSRKA